MARDFLINGPAMVTVKGGAHEPAFLSGPVQLGLADGPITVHPKFYYRNILTDDFGPNVPAEIMWNIAEVEIRMRLVHTDQLTLVRCWNEAMAGGGNGVGLGFWLSAAAGSALPGAPGTTPAEGFLAPAGSLMGNGLALFASGNHYISLNILSPVLGMPWRFRASFLSEPPFVFPLGTEKSIVDLTWRAIPYQPIQALSNSPGNSGDTIPLGSVTSGHATIVEVSSSGAPLWDHLLDT